MPEDHIQFVDECGRCRLRWNSLCMLRERARNSPTTFLTPTVGYDVTAGSHPRPRQLVVLPRVGQHLSLFDRIQQTPLDVRLQRASLVMFVSDERVFTVEGGEDLLFPGGNAIGDEPPRVCGKRIVSDNLYFYSKVAVEKCWAANDEAERRDLIFATTGATFLMPLFLIEWPSGVLALPELHCVF